MIFYSIYITKKLSLNNIHSRFITHNIMRTLLFFTALMLTVIGSQAQTATDALRYSNISLSGSTARTFGVGGSIGALGGDFSTLNSNPAGLGSYRSGEFMITPGYSVNEAASTFKNDAANPSYNQTSSNFTLNNIGIVFASQPFGGGAWKTSNFAIGYNRLADFNGSVYYKGQSTGSITSHFQQSANSDTTNLDQFGSNLAFQTGNIFRQYNAANTKYTYTSDFDQGPTAPDLKSQAINTSGSIGEVVLSYGANYDEKIQIGATLGIPIVNYTENKIYKESAVANSAIPAFNNLEYDENLSTTGYGVNLKIGMIAKVNQMLRLGLALHTPTIYSLRDDYNTALTYAYTDNTGGQNNTQNSPDGSFSYKFYTPWKAIGSVGLVFGRNGFISGEVERTAYNTARYSYSDAADKDQEAAVNADISSRFQSAFNFKIGGEYAYDIFRFRAGVNFNGSPIAGTSFYDKGYSLGFGVRGETAYFDLGYRNMQTSENYTPYLLDSTTQSQQQNVAIKNNNNAFIATVGFKF